jgi:hypothetical protein
MASMLGKRRRARPDRALARPVDDVAQAERVAMTALTETLRRLAADLPEDSLLAAEFASVARSIDVAGVVGTWRLSRLAGEVREDAATAHVAATAD